MKNDRKQNIISAEGLNQVLNLKDTSDWSWPTAGANVQFYTNVQMEAVTLMNSNERLGYTKLGCCQSVFLFDHLNS